MRATPLTLRSGATFALCASLVLLLGAAPRAQLVPKLPQVIPKAEAVVRLTGVWRGTATESTEELGELSFPVELRFSGEPDQLDLRVTGSVKVPTENGQKVTVAIAATYTGALRGADLRMRSVRVDTRIVETGTTIPSSPQTLEGKLENGVLEGRVGTAEDGWTKFTVRPAEARDEQAKPAATTLVGSWRGTGREPGPDGRELSYPVNVTVRNDGGRWTVEVAADLRYPVDNGGTTPVEYRATFEGEVKDGEVRMQSRSVKVRLVDHDRTQDGGQQSLNGRLEQGVLRLTVGNEGHAPSELELRRADDIPERATREPIREEGVEDEGARGNPQRRRGGPSAESPYGSLVLEPRQVVDPSMGGIASHTILVPSGWSFEGGARWLPSAENYVHFVAALHGPNRESVSFDWNRMLRWSNVAGQPPQPETSLDAGPEVAIQRAPPQTLGEVALAIIVPRLRPRAQDLRLVSAERLPEVEEAVRKLHAEELRMLEAMLAQSRSSVPGMQSDMQMFLVAERARVRYTEDGQEWEEEVRSTQQGTRGSIRSDLMSVDSGAWGIYDVRAARAPVGRLDGCLPTLFSLAGTLRETPRWSAALAELRLELAKARTKAMQVDTDARRRHYADLAKTRAEISDIQMQGWRSRQDSQDRMHKATIDSIRGTHDFRGGDGTNYVVSNQFERAFVDPGGRVILTNDVNYQPSGDQAVNRFQWQELQRRD